MKLFRIIAFAFGGIGLLLLALLALGYLLPSEWSAERTRTLDAPADLVLPYVDGARGWTRWTPAPESDVEYFGPERGEGSGHRWDDPGYGEGEFRITSLESPGRVTYEVEVEGGAIRIAGTMHVDPMGEGTRVVWREEGDFGWNPLLGYLAGRMDDLQGAQMEASLDALSRLVESDVLERQEVAPDGGMRSAEVTTNSR
ncbi:MAG: SRPBCC family protein [Gemmatimonadota bacterium]